MTTFGLGPTLPPTGLRSEAVGFHPGRSSMPEELSSSAAKLAADAGSVPAVRVGANGAPSPTNYHAVASDLRVTDGAMGEISQLLVQLREQLEMVKMYPPYPPNEPRRAALVRRLLGMQGRIDQIARGRAAAPVRTPAAAGVSAGTVQPQPVTSGREGLALDTVAADAEVGHVDNAIPAVDAARTLLADRRAALFQDASAAVDRSIGFTDSTPAADTLGGQIGQALASTGVGLARPGAASTLHRMG